MGGWRGGGGGGGVISTTHKQLLLLSLETHKFPATVEGNEVIIGIVITLHLRDVVQE